MAQGTSFLAPFQTDQADSFQIVLCSRMRFFLLIFSLGRLRFSFCRRWRVYFRLWP